MTKICYYYCFHSSDIFSFVISKTNQLKGFKLYVQSHLIFVTQRVLNYLSKNLKKISKLGNIMTKIGDNKMQYQL